MAFTDHLRNNQFMGTNLLVVAIGGAFGSVLRFLIGMLMNPTSVGAAFPWGTLVINIIGSATFGALVALFAEYWRVSDAIRLALLTGVLGGFTTFSSFAYEAFALANNGLPRLAFLYVLASNVLGLGSAWAAYRLAEWGVGRAT